MNLAPGVMARHVAAGRVATAAFCLAAPVPAARLLGVDTATASRVAWLTRMMAVRDGALGLGALLAQRRGRDVGLWLLGGAVSDAVDAVVIAGALKQGRVKGIVPTAVVPIAIVVAGAGPFSAASAGQS